MAVMAMRYFRVAVIQGIGDIITEAEVRTTKGIIILRNGREKEPENTIYSGRGEGLVSVRRDIVWIIRGAQTGGNIPFRGTGEQDHGIRQAFLLCEECLRRGVWGGDIVTRREGEALVSERGTIATT